MILALTLLAFQAAATPPAPPELTACDYIERYVWDPKFKPGQKWAYHSRPTDVGSTVTISEIDNLPGTGFVVYVVVDHISNQYDFPTPPKSLIAPVGVQQFVINRDSLDASVTELLDNVRIPDPGQFAYWRAHCLSETHATTVADTLTALDLKRCEQQLERQRQLKLPHRNPLPCEASTSAKKPSPTPTTLPPTSTPTSPTPSTPPTSIQTPPPSP